MAKYTMEQAQRLIEQYKNGYLPTDKEKEFHLRNLFSLISKAVKSVDWSVYQTIQEMNTRDVSVRKAVYNNLK